MKNYKIIASFVSPEEQETKFNKTGINLYDFYFSIRWKLSLMLYMFFSIWLRTGSNPLNINWFRSHTGNKFKFYGNTPFLKEIFGSWRSSPLSQQKKEIINFAYPRTKVSKKFFFKQKKMTKELIRSLDRTTGG